MFSYKLEQQHKQVMTCALPLTCAVPLTCDALLPCAVLRLLNKHGHDGPRVRAVPTLTYRKVVTIASKTIGTNENTNTMPTPSTSVLQRGYESLHLLDVLDVLVSKTCGKE